MNLQQILQSIENDVSKEFSRLREELKIHMEPGFDISNRRQFLKDHVPKEIMVKSELLLDTLLNYLMEQAIADLEKADIRLQNTFFDQNFRDRLKKWSQEMENQLRLDPAQIEFSRDTRWVYGGIAAGATVVVGSAITAAIAGSFAVTSATGTTAGSALVFVPGGVIAAILAGIATIIAAAIAFKITFNKAAPTSRKKVAQDIELYLKQSEQQALEWLKKITDVFASDFREFCQSNGFSPEG